MAIAYLNGTWLAPEEAMISVFDRGFMFGDGIYEVMAVYQGVVFMPDAHLQRLERSLAEIRLASPLTRDAWRELINAAVARSQEQTASLYLQVTRGLSMPRSPEYPAEDNPTILITVTQATSLNRQPPTPHRLVTKQDFRWGRGDIKVISLLANGLLRNEAIAEGYDDAVLIRDGLVTEATHANLFMVRNGLIITPPKSQYILHGITRQHILNIAGEAGLAVAERELTEQELLAADEVWLSSTGLEVWPVSEVNDRVIGNGAPGTLWQTVNDLFQASKLTNQPTSNPQ